MARKIHNTAKNITAANQASIFEPLEDRTMYSSTMPLTGYVQDWKLANTPITADNVDWKALSQIDYSFLVPNANGTLPGYNTSTNDTTQVTSASDDNATTELAAINSAIAANNSSIKLFVSVGGETATSAMNNLLDAGQSAYNTFASEMKTFVANNKLAGVDLDWEPTYATAGEITGFASLVTTLKGQGMTVTAAVLGDPAELVNNQTDLQPVNTSGTPVSTPVNEYQLDQTAIEALSSVEVMAYPATNETEANQAMTNWNTYLAGGSPDVQGHTLNTSTTPLSKLQYGLDDEDDTSNTTGVIQDKVNMSVTDGYGGMFLWDLQASNSNSVIAQLAADQPATAPTNPAPTTGTVSGTITSSTGAGVGGVTVYLDLNNNKTLDSNEMHATTAANGTYSFSNVPVGTPIIRQQLASGYTQTTPGSGNGIHLTVTAGENLTNENFVDTVPSTTPVSTAQQLTGTPIGTAGSYANDGNTIAKVFDGNLSTYFDAPSAGTASSPDWIGLDLGSAKAITQIKYAARSGYEYRMEGGIFQGSNTADFSSGVVNLATVGNTAAPSSTSLTTVNVSGTFRYVRFLAPAGSYGNISEMQVWGTATNSNAAVVNNAVVSPFSTQNTIGLSDESELGLA